MLERERPSYHPVAPLAVGSPSAPAPRHAVECRSVGEALGLRPVVQLGE